MLEYNVIKYLFLTMPEMFIIVYYIMTLYDKVGYHLDKVLIAHVFAFGLINFLAMSNPTLTNVVAILTNFMVLVYITNRYDLPKRKLFCTFVFIMSYIFIMQIIGIMGFSLIGVSLTPDLTAVFVLEGVIIMAFHVFMFRLLRTPIKKIFKKFSDFCSKFSTFKF